MFAITGFGYAFGDDQVVADVAADYVTDSERVLAWGCRTFHRAGDEVTGTDLAARAATDVLTRTGIDAGAVDMVVVAASELPEYVHWDPAAALARELGINERPTLVLTEGCAGGVTGLGLIAGVFAVQRDIDRVLFVAVNRVSEFHRNRMNVNDAVHSDGAVAVLLERDGAGPRWLATEQMTDPSLCDWFRTDYGGAVAPVPPPGWSSRTAPSGTERVHAYFGKKPRLLRDYLDAYERRSFDVVDRACKRASVDRAELAHIIWLNDNRTAIEEAARPFGVPAGRTNVAVAARHGHMGAADQLVALGEQLAAGEIGDGELVALTGTSIGMRWYCTLIRV